MLEQNDYYSMIELAAKYYGSVKVFFQTPPGNWALPM